MDLNGDGKLDVLYTNGDILDEPYLLKPYHGIQWLENKGDLKFEHHRDRATCTASTTRWRRTSLGNELARTCWPSVSCPPTSSPTAASARRTRWCCFEQVSPGKFERHTLAIGVCDAVVCAAADLYGTGRIDLVVGNFSSPTTDHPVDDLEEPRQKEVRVMGLIHRGGFSGAFAFLRCSSAFSLSPFFS